MKELAPNLAEIVQLGELRYLLSDGRLVEADGETEHLRAKSLRLLEVLAQHAGKIVSKDRLAELVWPDVTVTDESIGQCVADIRRAIGKDAHSVLETFPKRGYRLTIAIAFKANELPKPHDKMRGSLPLRVFIAIASAIAGLGLLLWASGFVPFLTADAPMITEIKAIAPHYDQSIAVLPFHNPQASPADTYFSEGLTEQLVANLTTLTQIKVVPSVTSAAFRDHDGNVEAISRALRARYLVLGSFRQLGQEIQISVQLIDGETGTNIWAKTYTGDRGRIFDYHMDILQSVTDGLALRLPDSEQKHMINGGTEIFSAYDAYLRGQKSAGQLTYDQSLEAERHFRTAIAQDPGYADAYAQLGLLFAIRFENSWVQLARADEEKAFFFAKRALELNPDLAVAEYALGRLSAVVSEPNFEQAFAHLRRAIQLAPGNDDFRVFYAVTHILKGDPDQALPIIEAAITASPFPPFWYHLARADALFSTRRYAEAAQALQSCLNQMPNAPYCLRLQIANFAQLDDIPASEWAAEEYAALGFEPSIATIMKAVITTNPENRAHWHRSLTMAGLQE